MDEPYRQFHAARRAHWDLVASRKRRGWGSYYHQRLIASYRHLIPAGSSVLEIGCGNGDLLTALQPGIGVGVDLSPRMIQLARSHNGSLEFVCGNILEIDLGDRQFDFVIFSDVINDLWDLQGVLQHVRRHCHPSTRLAFNYFNQLWKLPLGLAQKLGVATPVQLQNWFTAHDLGNMFQLSGYETLQTWSEILCPLPIPLLAGFCNRWLARLAPFRFFDLTNFAIARPVPGPDALNNRPLTVSVVVPARNEAGHIEALITRIPEMGAGTQIIFVEGNSTDNTYDVIVKAVADHPQRNCLVMKQRGKGKGDAVRLAFDKADGDILMILDADITVPPEDLPRFYDAIASGSGEFINGVRLVYPMQEEAMRFANLIGNKFFSLAFSWVLGQKIRDTLCGTKVIRATDYRRLAANRAYFGDFDPFGDFDLLFGAAKLNLKILEVPIRYGARSYGETNIQRWRHGVLLLRMVVFAARRFKFFY